MAFQRLIRVLPILVCVACLCGAAWVAFGGDWIGIGNPDPTPGGAEWQPEDSATFPLVFEKPEINLGAVKKAADGAFWFQNRGDVAATIHSVKGSCSCAVAALSEKVIPPGAKGVISVTYTVKPTQIGDQSAQIVVEYSANGPHKAILVVRAKNQPDVIAPSEVTLRCVAGKAASATFTLVDFRDEPLNVTRVTSSSPILDATVHQRPKAYLPGWQYEFRVTSNSPAPIPRTRMEIVTVYTSDPDRPTIVVAVRLEQVQRVRVAPAVLRLTDESATGSSPSGMLYVDDTEGEPVSVGSVTPSDACLQCAIERNGQMTPRITVRCIEALVKGSEGPLSVSVEILSPVREVVCSKVLVGRP